MMTEEHLRWRMQNHIGWVWVVGLCGSLAVANAQAPPAAPVGSSYDGTYRLVSSVT